MSLGFVNRAVFLLCISSFVVVGCISVRDSSGRIRSFPVEGPRETVAAADLRAIVTDMGDQKIYRLRIINRNRIEVDTSPERYQVVVRKGTPPETRSTQYVIFKRERGRWTRDAFYITVF